MAHSQAGIACSLIVVLVAAGLGAEVARLTVAAEVAETRPDLASKLAPYAPQSMSAVAMREVGQAAAKGGDPNLATMHQLADLSAVAPLHPEPFLVEAALAERKSDYDRAERLLEQARLREPRSVAARYLLADVSFRKGEIVKGLKQMAILSRLVPTTSVQLVPALSAYARTPGAEAKLAGVLAENEQLKRPLLTALSADPDNADLVLGLAGTDVKLTDVETQAWKTRLLQGFIARRDYQRSYDLWRRFAGISDGAPPLLFNGVFKKLDAPPPFNWNFSSSSAGVAEPDKDRLRVLYYGRDNTSLASQLLMLPAGSYRFAAPVSGQVAEGSLRWTIQCVGGAGQLGELRLGGAGSSQMAFTVPSGNCAAQWLELRGSAQDVPHPSDVQIGPARIERTGA